MTGLVAQLAYGLICGAAGLGLFLMLLNRLMILMPDSRIKGALAAAAFALLVGGGSLAGLCFATPPWMVIPGTLLALMFLGECRRILIRRGHAGSPPVGTMPHRVNLTAPVTTRDLVTHRYEVPLAKWRGERLRIVHLTDFHVHPAFSIEYYRDVMAAAAETEPDIAVLTGDFVTRAEAIPRLAQVLRPIARAGTYAVLGNHDYWSVPEEVRRVVTGNGLRLLTNETHIATAAGKPVAVTGCDFPWGTRERAIPRQAPELLHVVLSHTPDNVYRLSACAADLVFSGHCHAGQIRVPVLGSLVVPSVYGRRFDHGHFVIHGTHLFVASGIGAASPPLRIYCQPDIFVVDVVPNDG
jgi:predicted MPP superfamily phosphohydrolase